MREVSAKVVGSMVLVLGAIAALAAGVLMPVLNGFAFSGAARPALVESAARDERVRTEDRDAAAATSDPGGATPLTTPATRSERAMRLREQPVVPAGALAAAARMPATADMVLVVEDAADLRQSPVGDAAIRFVLDASGMTQTREAWGTLATQLGWSESEMFDRLLGRRVVLVARGFEDSATARWALLSDVSIETDERLKQRLEASQRSVADGHLILSVEKGRYELTSHRHAQVARKGAAPVAGAEVTIVLGPSGKNELFDEMVGVLARGANESLAGLPVMAAAVRAGVPEVLLMARLTQSGAALPDARTAGQSPSDRWADYVVLAGGRAKDAEGSDGTEFTSYIAYRDRRQRASNLALPPTDDTVFRAIERGSLLAIVQAAPVQQILGERARFLDAFRDLPLPDAARSVLAPRQVIALREVAAPGAEGEHSATHIIAVLGLETTSTSDLAPILDESITRFVAARELQFGILRPPPHNFGGRLPGVTRLLPLEVPDGNPLRLFVPDPLTLAWSYPHCRKHGPNAPGRPGWWLMSITPSPAGLDRLPEDSHNLVAEALVTRRAAAAERRWIWLCSLRAAALEARLPSTLLLPDVGGFRSAMKRFERVRIELSIGDDGEIEGQLLVRLAPTPAE